MTNRSVCALLIALLMIACSVPALAGETRLEKPVFGNGKLVLTFAADPLVTMTETPFAISITGPSGKVIKDAKLSLSLDMPAMPMPPNHPKATYLDDAYHGVAVFTMAGAWQVFINVQRPGYDQEQVVFDLEKVMMK